MSPARAPGSDPRRHPRGRRAVAARLRPPRRADHRRQNCWSSPRSVMWKLRGSSPVCCLTCCGHPVSSVSTCVHSALPRCMSSCCGWLWRRATPGLFSMSPTGNPLFVREGQAMADACGIRTGRRAPYSTSSVPGSIVSPPAAATSWRRRPLLGVTSRSRSSRQRWMNPPPGAFRSLTRRSPTACSTGSVTTAATGSPR